jgi:hypothetical protein
VRGSNFWEFERAGPPNICKGEEQSGLASPSLLSSIMNGPPCQDISGYPSTSSSFTHSANKLLNAGDGWPEISNWSHSWHANVYLVSSSGTFQPEYHEVSAIV